MPIIQFNLLEGRSAAQKRELARRVTDTVCDVLGCKAETVRILIHQLGAEDFSVAGITAADRATTSTSNGAGTPATATGTA